jgi:hypothetical protein
LLKPLCFTERSHTHSVHSPSDDATAAGGAVYAVNAGFTLELPARHTAVLPGVANGSKSGTSLVAVPPRLAALPLDRLLPSKRQTLLLRWQGGHGS